MISEKFLRYKDNEIVRIDKIFRIKLSYRSRRIGDTSKITYHIVFELEGGSEIYWYFQEDEEKRKKVYETINSLISLDITDMSNMDLI